VALGFIVEREAEIAIFKTQEYWTLRAKLASSATAAPFLALLVKAGEKKIEKLDLKSRSDVDAVLARLEGRNFGVLEVEERETARSSAPPFTTASLQQASYRALGYSPAKTMKLAQGLYEGKELPEGQEGLITYMRTDSISIASEARHAAAAYIRGEFGEAYVGTQTEKRFKHKAKFIQEAHEAIRPTAITRAPGTLASVLSPEEAKVYELIWVRFLQSQMADQRLSVTTAHIQAGDCLFRASGTRVLFDGFKKITLRADAEGEPESPAEQALPALRAGQTLEFREFVPQQHFTEPPPRYNAASLVRAMETNGVGRPSTYAPTIQTLLNRNYVRLEKKVFVASDLGRTVYVNLKKHFASIVDAGFTAKMENFLDLIARKKLESLAVLKDFWGLFEKDLEKAKTEMPVQKIQPQETSEVCEVCGSPMLLRESRFGRYLSCKKFPECKFKIGLTASGEKKVVKKTEVPCERCGAMLLERTGRRGPFLACPNFPKCRFTKTLPKPPPEPVPPATESAPPPAPAPEQGGPGSAQS
jgi:DNA topoisomerase-1